MSLGQCIPGMLKRGEIDRPRAQRMQELFDKLEAYYRPRMGPDAAAAEASEQTLRQMVRDARHKRFQTLLQINRQRAALKDIDRFLGDDRFAAISALLDDHDQAPYRFGNITTQTQIIENDAHRQLTDFIQNHRRNLLGKAKNAEGLDNVTRELHGQGTGDDRARVFADALKVVFEDLRQRFNAAGGNIRKLDGFGLPHRHDALKVRAVSREQWIADILPELDRAKMIDDRTGVPFTDDDLTQVLGDVYETIRTNGMTGEASAAMQGPGKLANQRSEHRFLHFRDGDAWLRYDAKYGSGDNAFTTVMGHISGMARDIATMERLGPNPDATMRYLIDHVRKTEAQAGNDKVLRGKPLSQVQAENLWRLVKGEAGIPAIPHTRVGYYSVRTIQGWRNLITARKLGGAAINAMTGDLATSGASRRLYGLSAISDVNNGLMAHAFRHLPEIKLFAERLKLLNPADASHRKLAIELGAGMQDAANSLSAVARFHGEAANPGWTSVAADSALRASGLNAITKAGQDTAYLDAMRTVGKYRAVTWGDLPAELRDAFEANGMDKADWTAIRQAPPLVSDGLEYIDPKAISDRRSADRFVGYALRYSASSVQESTPTLRAAMTQGTQSGTTVGELLRSAGQLKGFAVGMLIKQRRIMKTLGPVRGAAYFASFAIRLTVAGAMTMQLREIAKGNDPLPMDNLEFWEKAALQSGGLGIVGDLFGTMQDAIYGKRITNGVVGYFAGPLAGDIDNLARIAKTALPGRERKDGSYREANPAGAAVRLAQTMSPASSNWYMRAAFERMIIDQARAEWDPTNDQFVRRRDKQLEDNRQSQWWPAGSLEPNRIPHLANALGEESPR